MKTPISQFAPIMQRISPHDRDLITDACSAPWDRIRPELAHSEAAAEALQEIRDAAYHAEEYSAGLL